MRGNAVRRWMQLAQPDEHVLIDECCRVGMSGGELPAQLADEIAPSACNGEAERRRVIFVESERRARHRLWNLRAHAPPPACGVFAIHPIEPRVKVSVRW